MNESGYSWPEAILTLTIMMVIFSTLLPISFRMLSGLENKKHEMRAKETMYQGALLYTTYGISGGVRTEEGTQYSWSAENGQLCVTYPSSGKTETICIP
ncbi:hypothetical protein [Sporosarcina gallistercoris]|uniref:Type II secretion system protein n=1 Tax=Sporosarcina gallistercoris TaxID=2762245 RepID=A0ABR8PF64_9BACL|nr:hypothetical protein [Sporosarcina gallistercoris]MBD7906812.1 hypothetical protein [Sporosarcina gallistercoris]